MNVCLCQAVFSSTSCCIIMLRMKTECSQFNKFESEFEQLCVGTLQSCLKSFHILHVSDGVIQNEKAELLPVAQGTSHPGEGVGLRVFMKKTYKELDTLGDRKPRSR